MMPLNNTLKSDILYDALLKEKIIKSGQLNEIVDNFRAITQSFNLINPHSSKLSASQIWTHSDIMALWQKAMEEHRVTDHLDLYVGIPFCDGKKKCSYCMYPSVHNQNSAMIESYVSSLITLIRSMRPLFEQVQFNAVYFGGGTPNILNLHQMEALFSALFRQIEMHSPSAEITFENSPGLYDRKKIDLIKAYGINRTSFGVQSFDQKVLENENRAYYPPRFIEEIIKYCKVSGIQEVNIDLMLGLKGQTQGKFLQSLSHAFKTQADTITVYVYRELDKKPIPLEAQETLFAGYYRDFVYPTLQKAYELAEQRGYTNSGDPLRESQHFRKKQSKPLINRYRTQPFVQKKNSCLGIGAGSKSYINSPDYMLKYKTNNYHPGFSFKGKIFSGDELQREAIMRLYIREEFYRNRQINLREFREIFNEEMPNKFKFEIYCLQYLNKIKINDNTIAFVCNDNVDFGTHLKFFADQSEIQRYLNILNA